MYVCNFLLKHLESTSTCIVVERTRIGLGSSLVFQSSEFGCGQKANGMDFETFDRLARCSFFRAEQNKTHFDTCASLDRILL